MTQGFNNFLDAYNLRQPRLMIGTSGKSIPDPVLGKGINVNNWAGGAYASGGNPIIPNKSLFSKAGIRGLGGPIGAGIMLSEEAANAAKWAWNQNNLNTMAPSERNAILKAAGRENEIANYSKQRDTLDDLPMPPIARIVAELMQNGIKKSSSNKTNNVSSNNTGSSTSAGSKGAGGMSGQPTTQAQALALAQQLSGNAPDASQQDANTQQANVDAINDYISKLQEINQPYIEGLQNYYNNYNRLLDQQQRAARFWQGAASLTGNPAWSKMANYYNPVVNEANRLNTLKTLQDAQAGDLNAINEIMGNLAMAQEMGLSPEAAFANKNLLTMMAARDREANRYKIALENNLMKKYGIDRNYARALAVQAMRGQNALDVASMYTGAYGNGGGVAPGLTQQGTASNVPASYDTMLQAAHNKNNR